MSDQHFISVPSTVYNNRVYAIMQEISQKRGLTLTIDKGQISKENYVLAEITEGDMESTDPFTTAEPTVQVIYRYRSDSNGFGIDHRDRSRTPRKQFFIDASQMEDYFAALQQDIEDAVERHFTTTEESE